MKIFGIGLPKTGTTTLREALKELGFVPGGANKFDDPEAQIFVGDYMCLPKELFALVDIKYPGSKFILTTRLNPTVWYDSLCAWAEKKKNQEGVLAQRKNMYGFEMPQGHKLDFVTQYEEHNGRIIQYFLGRPDDLLVVCWEEGYGWKALCDFLHVPQPRKPFPHLNMNLAEIPRGL